ncbi:MAG: hypothetical protein ACE5IY_12185 [bacterium]
MILFFTTAFASSSNFAAYPENRIVLMQEILDRTSLKQWQKEITKALASLSIEEAVKLEFRINTISTTSGLKRSVGTTNLTTLFIQKERKMWQDVWLHGIERLYKGYDHLVKEEYTQALNELGGVGKIVPQQITRKVLAELTNIPPELGGPDYIKASIDEIIDGGYYWVDCPGCPSYSNQEIQPGIDGYLKKIKNYKINVSADVINQYNQRVDHFNGFNVEMLRAEAYRGLGDFRAAEQIYRRLLFPKPDRFGERFAPFQLSDAERKLIRIRRATNFLAWGDHFFRSAHGLIPQDQQASLDSAKVKYQSAVDQFPAALFALIENDKLHIDSRIARANQLDEQLLSELSGMPTGGGSWGMQSDQPSGGGVWGQATNPLVIEAVSHAKMQMFKIDKHLNYLGYTEGYVPAQRYAFLFNRAKEYANLAIQTELRYIQFKKEAEDQEYQVRLLQQESQIAGYPAQMARLRQKIAEDRISQATLRLNAIDKQIHDLRNPGFFGQFFGAIKMFAGVAAAPFSGGSSLAITASMGTTFGSWMAGQISNEMSTDSKIAALLRQQQAVRFDKSMATKQAVIAGLEESIARIKQDFVYENMRYLETKELTRELYFNLAKSLKRIKQTYLDAGIRTAYLTERALAFESDRPDLQFVKFDYGRAELKNLMAGDFLLQDLLMMEYDRTLSLKQRNHVKHVISLRQKYPIQFVQFLHSGEMIFATELYDFDKAYPGTYQRRLRRVELAIQGLVGPEGFKGSLTNFGTFIVRTKDGTLGTSTARLLPTEAKLNQAYREMITRGLSSVEVGGVHAYQLPSARLVLSKYDLRRDGVIFPAEVEVRETFEDFGLGGVWKLELPKNLNDVDYRTIADVQVILYFDAFYDAELENKVKTLVQKYEHELTNGKPLDRVAMFSLRHHFPDEFFGISGGAVAFELLHGDFPLYAENKKVKKVIVQAVDKDGRGLQGIGMTITHTGSSGLTINALTGADGFSSDPTKMSDLPLSDQVAITGAWNIKLTNTAQASQVADLIVFIQYEFEEKST